MMADGDTLKRCPFHNTQALFNSLNITDYILINA